MKKLGTPIGAGPGSANENVGFDAFGTPPLPRRAPGLDFGLGELFFGAGFLCFFGFELWCLAGAGLALCVLEGCFRVGPLGCGGVAAGVVVVVFFGVVVVVGVVVEGEPDVEVVLGVVVVLGVAVVLGVVVVLGAVVVAGLGEQDSVTFETGPVTGSLIADSGVPGGTSTVKVNVWPLSRVTVTTHESADALGSAAMPLTASAAATATNSFRLLNTGVLILPRSVVRTVQRRDEDAAWIGRY